MLSVLGGEEVGSVGESVHGLDCLGLDVVRGRRGGFLPAATRGTAYGDHTNSEASAIHAFPWIGDPCGGNITVTLPSSHTTTNGDAITNGNAPSDDNTASDGDGSAQRYPVPTANCPTCRSYSASVGSHARRFISRPPAAAYASGGST